MARLVVSDKLWALVEPRLPKQPPRPKGDRPPLDEHKALTGIVFALRTGIPWEDIPRDWNAGSE